MEPPARGLVRASVVQKFGSGQQRPQVAGEEDAKTDQAEAQDAMGCQGYYCTRRNVGKRTLLHVVDSFADMYVSSRDLLFV